MVNREIKYKIELGTESTESIINRYMENFISIPKEIISFSVFNGIPSFCNIIFDARVISNPPSNLFGLDGMSDAVQKFVYSDPEYNRFFEYILTTIRNLKPTSVGIGCVGGHHRSVATAEMLGHLLKIIPFHRELFSGTFNNR